MKNLFQENKNSALLLLVLLFVLLIVIYFLFFQPLSQELKDTENQVERTENEVAILESHLESAAEDDSNELERLESGNELPNTPELETFILTLEKIESVSNSKMDNIRFSYDGSVPERMTDEGENEDELVPDNEMELTEQAAEPELAIDMAEKPENLHVITISMSVLSPDYDHFQTFLKEIENQERMMMVSSMNFQKPSEVDLLFNENPDESITATVDIHTFYYEE